MSVCVFACACVCGAKRRKMDGGNLGNICAGYGEIITLSAFEFKKKGY